MRRIRLIASVLFAAGVLVPGGATWSSAQPQTAGQPDTFVTDWDTVATRAFSAAAVPPPTGQGLTPVDGHLIFAYLAIAVYDSVIAIEGGYEPFTIDVDGHVGPRDIQCSR